MGALACKTKIIIDVDNLAGFAEGLCEATKELSDEQVVKLTDQVGYSIIRSLNEAEKLVLGAQKILLDTVGYDGPRPDYLK